MAQDTLLGFPAHTLPYRRGEFITLLTVTPGGHRVCPPGFSAGNPDFFKFPLDNGNAPPYNPINLLDWLYLFAQKRGFP